jgi:predicted nucleotidyltransferase
MKAEAVDGMRLAREGAAFLYRQGATRVWVFGSVAKGRRLDFRSDIDFAVEGIAAAHFLRVGAELENLLDFPVDLIELERASAALRAQVESHGILLPDEN